VGEGVLDDGASYEAGAAQHQNAHSGELTDGAAKRDLVFRPADGCWLVVGG